MIPFLIYFIVLIALIYKNGFFGFFNDSVISRKHMSVLFFIKCLAIPAFYLVYEKVYGGVANFDSGKFFNDASVISDIAKKDVFTYFKILFGFQNDTPGSYDFLLVRNTLNWDNGEIKDFLYNDNRVLIRIHSLVHFISFNSFFVHALFSCFISTVGIFYLYKTFKGYFIGKEIWMMILMCLFPALWFYTGAPLKEGLSLFVLGASLFLLKKLISESVTFEHLFIFLVLVWISLLLKPYLLLLAILCFSIFFSIEERSSKNFKLTLFTLILGGFIISLNLLAVFVKHKSLPNAALQHQRIFAGVAKGGIFLYNDEQFIRLPYDTTLIQGLKKTPTIFTIRSQANYMYWKTGASHDTLYCDSNADTLTRYQLAFKIAPNHSNLEPLIYSKGIFSLVVNCYYYTLAYPLFFNAKNVLQYLASLENLVILVAFLIILIGMIQRKKDNFLPIVFLSFALSICLLIGIATPNSGAIFRYRSPAMIFVLMAALYYIDLDKLKIFRHNP